MSGADLETLVVGAGVAGLAAARELSARGREVCVVDAGTRVGGVMQTDVVGGYRVEAGPNTVLARAPLWSFAERHGLLGALARAQPESRRRALLRGGRLVALPSGPLAAAASPLLSLRGKLRVLGEPFVPRGDPTGESVHDFVARRLGAEVATGLVGAFLTGVYAGDERELGVEAVFPSLVELERAHGGLVRGGLASLIGRLRGRKDEPASRAPGTWSAPGGLGSFSAAIADGLAKAPLLETRVASLARADEGFRATLAGPDGEHEVVARRVVVATPAHEAAMLLRSFVPEAAKTLEQIDYAPIATVALGIDPAATREPVEGFGFLIPRAEGLRLRGCLFMSRLFGDRAPAGRELLHCMQGGTRWREAVDLDDDELVRATLEDLDRCVGLRADPETVTLRRWPRAIPQPGREHVRLVADVMRGVRSVPGLALAGGYVAGVSVPDTIGSGVGAVAQLDRAD